MKNFILVLILLGSMKSFATLEPVDSKESISIQNAVNAQVNRQNGIIGNCEIGWGELKKKNANINVRLGDWSFVFRETEQNKAPGLLYTDYDPNNIKYVDKAFRLYVYLDGANVNIINMVFQRLELKKYNRGTTLNPKWESVLEVAQEINCSN